MTEELHTMYIVLALVLVADWAVLWYFVRMAHRREK